MAGIGQGKDTEGSRRIIAELNKPDPRPLWIAGWGGPNTLDQALLTLRATRSPAELKRLVAKLRVSTTSDQDAFGPRSEAHKSELPSLTRISYDVFCLKNKKNTHCQRYS